MASLKDQLDQAGYDTSNLDEAAILKQLSDAGYDVSGFSAPSQNIVGNVAKNLLPSLDTLKAPITASNKLGTMVEAGGAGLGDLAQNAAGQTKDLLNQEIHNRFRSNQIPPSAPPMDQSVLQAGQDVRNVLAGTPPETTAGKVGKTVGSFFTPNQIAAQATGTVAAPLVAEGLGNVATPTIKALVNAFPKASSWAGLEPEAVGALAEAPEAVAGAKPLTQTAKDVAGTVQGLSEQGMESAAAAKEALSSTVPVTGLRDKLMNYAATIANSPGADEADKAAADYVTKYAQNLELNPSETKVQALIDDLDSKINTKYNKTNPGPLLDAKIGVRRTLSQVLQGQNAEYAKGMAASQATFEPTEALGKSFGVEGGMPSDRTIQALRNKASPEALATQQALASSFPGLSSTISNSVAKDALQNSLLGKLALYLTPKVGGLVQGGVQTLPVLGNAAAQTYNGLTQ